jgi:hypothetical protein
MHLVLLFLTLTKREIIEDSEIEGDVIVRMEMMLHHRKKPWLKNHGYTILKFFFNKFLTRILHLFHPTLSPWWMCRRQQFES